MGTKTQEYDVAIIGGGPGGSTTGALIKKYAPHLSVVILEKELFPRDHVGESQLPSVSEILNEMGCWDKIEAADFPVKVGATYRWGKSPELWDFEFALPKEVETATRPSKFEGVRKKTAFQVDRAIYDDILLKHAGELGAEVRQQTRVTKVIRNGDSVDCLQLDNGDRLKAKYYVDASGHIGILRKAMDVDIDVHESLQNIAFWDYWENADWAVEIGVGATRVQVMSQSAGWLWFIPLGPTRTSIGYVVPAEHYKSLGETPEKVYQDAIDRDPKISKLIENATSRGMVEGTKDWSFIAKRGHGDNWFLVGESMGFADPILAAGLTLTHTGGRELAYTLVNLLSENAQIDETWLKQSYSNTQFRRINQHIRFADYWYSANGQFTDLKEHCASIAKDAGLKLTPEKAWAWLARGGFTNEGLGQPAAGSFDLPSLRLAMEIMTDQDNDWELNKFNQFKLNLSNAKQSEFPIYSAGEISKVSCWVRGENRLPITGPYGVLIEVLQQERRIDLIMKKLQQYYPTYSKGGTLGPDSPIRSVLLALEAMLTEGWVIGKKDKKRPMMQLGFPKENEIIHWNKDDISTSN